MKKILLLLLKGLLIGLALFVLVTMGSYYWYVMREPGEGISQGGIDDILTMESPVYYSDGSAKIGVFFEDAHRQ
jgi:penicillin-binding protein 1A